MIRQDVNEGLKNIPIPDYPRYLYDPIRYSIINNGKRFRPILAHLTGRANNIEPNEYITCLPEDLTKAD